MSASARSRVKNLYKTLLHLGKEYPKGYDYFKARVKPAFMRNKDITDPELIDQKIRHGEFVVKELEALYMLKKYRTLKRRYYDK
uniref:Complex 1 LYR protein domain-containing protein n=1 Tax=Strigamia maritima TaxID=126957 RepID=T1IXW2_STRMM